MHIRYYGFLANRNRHQKLQRIRSLLETEPASKQNPADSDVNPTSDARDVPPDESTLCPQCKSGRLLLVQIIPAHPDRPRSSWSYDSS
jgi:hypothetical protein